MTTTTTEAHDGTRLVRNLPVEEIRTDGKNGTARTTGPAFEEFSADVAAHGVLQAVLVRALPGKGRAEGGYHLIAGHRRLAAAKKAGHAEIPAVISTAPAEADEELRLVENLHRENLHPLDEADGYAKLLAATKAEHGVAIVAQKVGRSVRYVYDRLRFMELTADARRLFRSGKIEAGHAVILARLSAADQKRALDPESNRAALFEREDPLFDPLRDEGTHNAPSKDPWDGYKARTANELQGWVDAHVRATPASVDPMLFPVTHEELAAAKKVIPITREYHLQDSAKSSKERTFGPMSWKRADGKHKSKTCTFSAVGFVVAGDGRNESFLVCMAKDKCTVHWAERVKAQAKKAAAKSKRLAKGDPKAAAAKEAEREKRSEARERAEHKAAESARKMIVAAAFEAGQKMSLVELVRIYLGKNYGVNDLKQLTGESVTIAGADEKTLRRVFVATIVSHDWNGDNAKAMGVDIKAIRAKAEADELAKLEPAKPAAEQKAAKSAKPPKGQRPRKRGVANKK